MPTDADALPRIDKRYGEKCAALLWQLQQNEPAAQEQTSATNRKSVLAAKYGIAVPKSAGCRGPGTGSAAGGSGNENSARKQQRPSSTRAMAKKADDMNSSFDQASHATRTRFSSSRGFNNSESDQVQAQQLEAAQTGDPIRAFSSPRSFANGNMYADSSSAELELVRSENDNLRLEISVLHEKMMEKMRGGSKIVAGGQFRGRAMALGSKNAQPPSTTINCSTCATLRLDLKRSRHEFTHSQHISEELPREIAKMEAIQHTLWAESSSQQREIKGLREAIAEFQQTQDSKDDQIRMLEQQIEVNHNTRTVENNNGATNSGFRASSVDSATQCSLSQSNQEQLTDADLLARRNASLEEELERLKLELVAHEMEMKRTFRLYHEAQEALGKEKNAYEAYRSEHTKCEENYTRQLNQLKQTLEETCQVLVTLQECKATDLLQLEELNKMKARLDEQVQQHTATVNELEAANQALQNVNHRLQTQITELEARNASQSSEAGEIISRLQEVQARNSHLASENTRHRHESQEFVRQLSEQNQEIQETQAELVTLGSEIDRWQRKSQSLEAELQVAGTRLQEALASSNEHQELMQAQLAALEYESMHNEDFVIKLKNSHAVTLGDTLHSMIRLCVVAPTVNVHLSETSTTRSNASKNDPVVCKPAPPHDRIRDIVENEVLPQFSRLILQEEGEEERGSSVGESPSSSAIEPWVRDLLQSMQKKIVEQLRSIYQTTGARQMKEK